jgi:hypothetical protein
VADCTTSLQPKPDSENKTDCNAQSFGCGCAKQLFPTTTKKKQENNS